MHTSPAAQPLRGLVFGLWRNRHRGLASAKAWEKGLGIGAGEQVTDYGCEADADENCMVEIMFVEGVECLECALDFVSFDEGGDNFFEGCRLRNGRFNGSVEKVCNGEDDADVIWREGLVGRAERCGSGCT